MRMSLFGKSLLLGLMFSIQIPVFALNNLDIEAGNPVQLISNTSQYVRVTGTVSSTDISGRSKVIFLNFGKNFNTSFTAIIHDDAVPSFAIAGISEPAEYFKDKTVIIEGILRLSDGKPEMIIESPDQIKIVKK